jgi:hypothetical protein
MLEKLNTIDPNHRFETSTNHSVYTWMFKPSERGVYKSEVSLAMRVPFYRSHYDAAGLYNKSEISIKAGTIELNMRHDFGRMHPPLVYGLINYVLELDKKAQVEVQRKEKEERVTSLNMVKAMFDMLPPNGDKRKITINEEDQTK